MTDNPRTVRFLSELETAESIVAEAHRRGWFLTLEQAHELWAEHSEDYCAGWLAPDSENPRAEMWRAITKWHARHTPKLDDTP